MRRGQNVPLPLNRRPHGEYALEPFGGVVRVVPQMALIRGVLEDEDGEIEDFRCPGGLRCVQALFQAVRVKKVVSVEEDEPVGVGVFDGHVAASAGPFGSRLR